MAELGITVSYETIRRWCRKFGAEFARKLRRRQGRLGDTWHLDKLFVTIRGQRQYQLLVLGVGLVLYAASARDMLFDWAVAGDVGNSGILCMLSPSEAENTVRAIPSELLDSTGYIGRYGEPEWLRNAAQLTWRVRARGNPDSLWPRRVSKNLATVEL